jgi:hypothetical protein
LLLLALNTSQSKLKYFEEGENEMTRKNWKNSEKKRGIPTL